MAERYHRRSIRLRGYDYARAGAYYVTVCTHERGHIFGHIADGVMMPNTMGELAQRCWDAIPEHMPHVDVGEFVVMPNHVHGIVVIRERLVDVHGGATDGAVGGVSDGVMGVGARHDAPNTNATAPDANAPNVIPRPDPPTEYDDDPNTPGPHTGARHDAPLPNTPPTDPRAKPPGIPSGALGQIVASFKSSVTRIAYRDGLLPRGTPIWQRGYYEHIIRDDAEHDRIARYIADNLRNWKGDRFNR
ncbi:MAG: hypothetical protein IPP83_01255 [Flavobacteriales bacterium]|nr:hypothetical protein [Flavobacteriales bacterium]